MSDLDDLVADPVLRTRVGEHLTYLAATADVRRTPVEAIARRAATRRRRQRMAGTTGAVALTIGAVIGVVAFTGPSPSIAPQETPPSVTTGHPAPTSTPSTVTSTTETTDNRLLRWDVAPDDLASGYHAVVRGESGASSPDVRLSTDPSEPAVFSTDDGLVWQRIDLPRGFVPVAATRIDGHVHAIVIDDSTSDTSSILLASNDGLEWSYRPIPAEASSLGPADIAATENVVVLTVVIDETWRIFRAAVEGPIVDVTEATPTDPLDPAAPLPHVQRIGDRIALFAPLRSASGALGPDGALATLGAEPWEILTSEDGTRWTTDVTSVSRCCPTRWHGGWLGLDDMNRLQASTDGETWTSLDPDLGDDSWAVLPGSLVVDDAVVTFVASRPAPLVPLRLSENGVTMVFDQTMQLLEVYDDATGALIGSTADAGASDLIELDTNAPPTLRVFSEDGSVRAEFTVDEASAVVASTPATAADLVVVQSADLTTWSTTDLASLVGGEPLYVEPVGAFDGRIVYRVFDRDDRYRTIVGTSV